MDENIQLIAEDAEDNMKKAIDYLAKTLTSIRAGKADAGLLNNIKVDYYGTETPLSQAANVSTPDSRTIAIQPWEKTMIAPIEKAIIDSNIGLTPVNNGDVIRLVMPPLTEERRKDLVKQVKGEGENCKVSLRNIRRDANEEIKKLQKDGISEDEIKVGETAIQEITDKYSKESDKYIAKKEEDIMTV